MINLTKEYSRSGGGQTRNLQITCPDAHLTEPPRGTLRGKRICSQEGQILSFYIVDPWVTPFHKGGKKQDLDSCLPILIS